MRNKTAEAEPNVGGAQARGVEVQANGLGQGKANADAQRNQSTRDLQSRS